MATAGAVVDPARNRQNVLVFSYDNREIPYKILAWQLTDLPRAPGDKLLLLELGTPVKEFRTFLH
jgi:hypothetical protein